MPRKNNQKRGKGKRGRRLREETETGPSSTEGQAAATPASSSEEMTAEREYMNLQPQTPQEELMEQTVLMEQQRRSEQHQIQQLQEDEKLSVEASRECGECSRAAASRYISPWFLVQGLKI